MTMFPIAHAGGVISALLYLVPLLVLVAVLVQTKINDRRDGAPADDEETEPTGGWLSAGEAPRTVPGIQHREWLEGRSG